MFSIFFYIAVHLLPPITFTMILGFYILTMYLFTYMIQFTQNIITVNNFKQEMLYE